MRDPNDFVAPRTWLISAVRAATATSRARLTAKSAWHCSERCLTGDSSSGSARPRRASSSASVRSFLRSLRVINATLRGLDGTGASVQWKEQVHKMADANKAYAHYANH